MSPTGNDALSLLAYPLDDALLGEVHVYEFADHVGEAWTDLRDRYSDQTGSGANLPYAGLATALRGAGRTSANFHPTSKKAPPQRLITRHRLDPDDLYDAVTIWEQALLNVPHDDIRLSYASKLADLIAGTQPRRIRLFDEIRLRGRQPDAAGWVYEAATWQAAQYLARTPLSVDDRSIDLRADTDGNLTVWELDQLWTGHWPKKPEPVHYACLRVTLSMRTLPGVTTPVLVLEPAVSRLSRWINSCRSAWLTQLDAAAPLLKLELEGRGPATRIERTSELALTVWSRLRMEPSPLPDDRDLSGLPGRLRATIPKSTHSPIGRGVGMETIRRMSDWASQSLQTNPVRAHNVAGHQFAGRRALKDGRDAAMLDPAALPGIIEASGRHHLRIVALYQHHHTRARMRRLLAHHFSRPDLAQASIEDGVATPLAPHVELVFHEADELLRHGNSTDRQRLAGKITALKPDAETRVLALCETEYDAEQWDERRKRSRQRDSDVVDPYTIDAKPEVNRILAALGAPSQFLATVAPAEAVDVATDASDEERLTAEVRKDHPGHSAIADLLRSAGLIHHRLSTALSKGRLGTTDPITHVGLHIRQQNDTAARRGAQRLSWTLAALIPLEDGRWRTMAYQPPVDGGGGWMDYAQANAAMRARPLPAGRRYDPAFPSAIETALDQLREHIRCGAGYVLYVSGDSTRSLWPLLANRNLEQSVDAAGEFEGKIALPGNSLPSDGQPRALVRVTSGTSDLARPVSAVKTTVKKGEHTKTLIKAPTGLHQVDQAVDTWVLSNVPRQFSGGTASSRVGEHYSRWSAKKPDVKRTWYALTATEITVIRSIDDALGHAVAAARLCDHAISWDGRTRYPAPVHLAMQLDKDHPDYRRSTAEANGGDES
ncbi:RNaseH domain-containing protein [Streptomonospora wellingtoniae]|uniref:RNaseH domain-containing protein n=1 Tax=Streptomonospora wellingtoniae TaxID=3075544 RepID=A0ABU2KN71_9ACTN|nr:RNaseH domain-containing protein [Streptomonospora sp. DSM 45055]MDT0300608.1 RNaseH domain-containing protein [Streptomonospora sp. DSM 45055]